MRIIESENRMREGMRCLGAGVCVVSSLDAQRQPFAMTATSVTSVSDCPASLLVCVNRAASIQRAISETGRFCVNVLRSDQQAISNLCATGEEGRTRFALGDWIAIDQLPYLGDCLAVFKCTTDRMIDYGTHRIYIGLIDEVMVDDSAEPDPLAYLNGRYRSMSQVP